MTKLNLSVTSFLLLLLFIVMTTTVGAAEKTEAEVIMELVDTDDFEKAKQKIDEHLEKKPNSTAVRYQLARYYLRTDGTANDSIIGYTYTDESAELAIAELGKVIKENANHVESYSLLGHIYAVLNQPKLAALNFEKAEESYDRPAWLDVNKAMLAIQQEEFSDAAELLKEYTAVRPNKNDYVGGRVYTGAWQLLKRLSVKHPELDPVPAIRKGFIKRVLAEDYLAYVENTKNSELPTFTHLASSDNWCKPCTTSLKRIENIARKHGDKFNFIHVSFEPWESVSYYQDIVDFSGIMGLPSREIVSKGKSQAQITGILANSAVEKIMNELYDDLKSGTFADKQ